MDSSSKATTDNLEIEFFTPDEKPYGLSYGNWTAKWWQWAHFAPIHKNPVTDETGVYAAVNQEGPVWFLAGTFGENKVPHRKCVIPYDKSILIPVINYEMNSLEKPELKTNEELVQHVMQDIDDIVVKEAIIDGKPIPIYRVKSDPEIFPLTINKDNAMRIKGGSTRAAADGYWIFLKPLPAGSHHIYFHGSCSGGIRNATADYQLTIS